MGAELLSRDGTFGEYVRQGLGLQLAVCFERAVGTISAERATVRPALATRACWNDTTSTRFTLMWRVILLSGLLLSGCGKKSVEHTEDSDRLHMCVDPPSGFRYRAGVEPVARYLPDEPVQVEVLYRGCLQHSCSTERMASCSVSRSGQTLTVTAKLSWIQATSGPCTLDCAWLTATCASEPLSAGTYRVVFGERSTTLTVTTSSTARPCIDPPED